MSATEEKERPTLPVAAVARHSSTNRVSALSQRLDAHCGEENPEPATSDARSGKLCRSGLRFG